ncbi:molecular chaperone [Bordetella sp. BOR01]|uniref:fimbrial biogenesis chaperone n=1 Tax=Bordetella sp. BOR01 TaxID=2854779 RepID=UPI002102B02C|nr:molecular chaperone [Bordetella sp. BOR01]
MRTLHHVAMRLAARVLATLALGLAVVAAAQAAVHVQTSRVIYPAKAASASVAISNKSTLPYLVQAWLDTGDPSVIPDDLPIAITPPLLRLSPGEEALLRAVYAGQGLPTDRESVLWINVQEIPPSSDASNALQIAIRTRIKLFYRPASLQVSLDEAARALQWRVDGKTLVITNPSALHITFSHVQGQSVAGGGQGIDLDMIAPGQTLAVPLAQLRLSDASVLRFGYINDYGGTSEIIDATLQR